MDPAPTAFGSEEMLLRIREGRVVPGVRSNFFDMPAGDSGGDTTPHRLQALRLARPLGVPEEALGPQAELPEVGGMPGPAFDRAGSRPVRSQVEADGPVFDVSYDSQCSGRRCARRFQHG